MELNQDIKNRFLALIENEKITHSYIVSGGNGSGKLDFALFCAKAVFCGGNPCGKCDHCRKIENESHPDVIIVNKDSATSFKIDEIRRVTESINVPPNEAKKKIYILDHCENMTVQAQNALLKAFEEPPEYVLFFILTEKKEALLPTVRSRATLFSISPMDKDSLMLMMKKKFPKETEETLMDAVRLSEGFYGRALKLMEKNAIEERKTALLLSEYIIGEKSGYKTAKLLNGYKNKRDSAVRLLLFVLYALRDTVLYKNGGNDICFLSEALAEKYSANTSNRLSGLADGIEEAIYSLENNGNYTSCIAKLCGIII